MINQQLPFWRWCFWFSRIYFLLYVLLFCCSCCCCCIFCCWFYGARIRLVAFLWLVNFVCFWFWFGILLSVLSLLALARSFSLSLPLPVAVSFWHSLACCFGFYWAQWTIKTRIASANCAALDKSLMDGYAQRVSLSHTHTFTHTHTQAHTHTLTRQSVKIALPCFGFTFAFSLTFGSCQKWPLQVSKCRGAPPHLAARPCPHWSCFWQASRAAGKSAKTQRRRRQQQNAALNY